MKSIKVLHCIHSLYGGGAETQLRVLSSNGGCVSIKSAVYCHDTRITELSENGVEIYVNEHSYFDLISSFKSVNNAIKSFKPDIVHVWLPPPVTVPAMLAAFINRKPCIGSYRNKMFFGSIKNYVQYIFTLIFSCKVISNNPVSQSSYLFRKLFNIKRGQEIPNAVLVSDDLHWCPSDSEAFKFLFVGRLTKQKNLEFLLTALSNISSNKEWSLTVCGDGEDRGALESLVERLNLSGFVDFQGFSDDVHKVMAQHHMLVVPSLFEGMPNVVVEAMAIGLPCALSNIESHKWVIGNSDSAIFFDIDNSVSLEKVLIGSLDSKFNLDVLSRKGIACSEKYSVKSLLDQYRLAYEKVL